MEVCEAIDGMKKVIKNNKKYKRMFIVSHAGSAIPSYCAAMLVEQDAFQGDYTENPFQFPSKNLNMIKITIGKHYFLLTLIHSNSL